MATERSTGKIMKAGLILAAALVVVRIVLEQVGAPQNVNMIFGVAWLYFLLPICFALRIAAAREPRPFLGLFKDVLLFAVYTRVMVMATYIIAYFLKWQAPRFSVSGGGSVGPNIGILEGVVWIPVRNALVWIVTALVLGMAIGSVALLVGRKTSSAPATQ